jgi:putative transcriptional regulator
MLNMAKMAPRIQWRLRQVMADRRLTNKDLAIAVNRHPATICNLRRHETLPRIDNELLTSLCQALNCDISDLMIFRQD